MAVITKTCKRVSYDEKLEKLQNMWVPNINGNFPAAASTEKLKRESQH
jgi:hypothetical protein